MKSEEVGDNVTDFGEAKARLDQNRGKGLFLRNSKSTLALSIFLYGVNDSIEKGEVDLGNEQKLVLRRLLPEFTRSLASTSAINIIHISRNDIDTIGDWAVSAKVSSRRDKRALYKALLDLNKEFVMVSGPENTEFKERIKSIVDQK